jgi:hypothetical protein
VIDGILRPLIEGVQGSLQPEDLAAAGADGRVTQQRDDPLKAGTKGPEKRTHEGYRGSAHILAFSLFVADGMLTAIDLLHHAAGTIVMANILAAAGVVCIIIALIKQRGSIPSKSLRNVSWASFAFVCLSYVPSYWLGVFAIVQTRKPMAAQWMTSLDIYRAMLRFSPQGSPILMAIYGVEAAGAFIMGALGLVLALKARPARAVSAGPHVMKEVAYKP